MEESPDDLIILSAIYQGVRKPSKIVKKTRISDDKFKTLLDRLEKNGLVETVEKKGFFGPKKEIVLTEKGQKDLEERRFELQEKWDGLVTLWKGGDKENLQQQMDSNRSMFPAMMFMGIMDMMMFSSMMSFMGLAMASFMPDQYMYDSGTSDIGHDAGSDTGHDASGGDWGNTDLGHDMGGFDVNF